MNVFISYSRKDASSAQSLNAALNAAGIDTFLDAKDLPPGQEFNSRIKASVDNADLFIFLASSNSVNPGSYTMTELAFAEAKWRNPAGYVLPVALRDFDPGDLPTYLRPISALQIRGNLEAEVVGWIQERMKESGGGVPGQLTLGARLQQWAGMSQPPIRKIKGKIPGSSVMFLLAGLSAIGFGSYVINSILEWNKKNPTGSLAHTDLFEIPQLSLITIQ